jgi:type I restriction enzyme S subunit
LRQRVSELKTGPFGSALSADEYVDEGVPLINPSDLRYGRIWPERAVKVPLDVAVRMSSYRVKCGDVVLARRGELGRYGLVGPDEDGFLCGTGSLFLRPGPQLEARFFGYYLETAEARDWLSLQSVGSTMENLSEGIMARLPIPDHSRHSQKNIADFLDDKTARIDALIAEKERLVGTLVDG